MKSTTSSTAKPAANRRHGVWRCICGAELYAKPCDGSKKQHSRLTVYASKDYVGRWIYEDHNDQFFHRHQGKIGLLRADFVEDRSGGAGHQRAAE